MNRQSPEQTPVILLVGNSALHRDTCWEHLALPSLTLKPLLKRSFDLRAHLSPCVEAIIYQTGPRTAETLQFLDDVATRQNDLCVILIGRQGKADTVAQFLRRGAFDYITWPAPHARMADSIASGLANRRTFLEVRNLSGDLAEANAALAHERDMLRQHTQRLAGLNQLTQALARSLDPEGVVRALFDALPSVIDADLLGLVRTNPEHAWTWSKVPYQDREAQLRTQLLSRLGRSPERVTSGATTLRLVESRGLHLETPADPAQTEHSMASGGFHDVPLAIGPHAIGVLHIARTTMRPFSEQDQQLLATVGTSLSLALRNADAHQHLQDVALRDPLTGTLNRRAIEGPLLRELKSGLRYGAPASLMMIDLDFFKTVNDRLGHQAGDAVLKAVAALITDTVRDIDVVGRYGGEEFAIVLPHTAIESAHALAERLRAAVERHAFELEDGTVRLTISIGIADVHDPAIASITDWITAADSALYEAKAQGRNRVIVHAPAPLAPAQAARLCMAA